MAARRPARPTRCRSARSTGRGSRKRKSSCSGGSGSSPKSPRSRERCACRSTPARRCTRTPTRRRCRARSGRVQKNVIIIPMSKSKEWWDKQALDRQTYFYPHADARRRARQGTRAGRGARHQHDLPQAVLQPRRPRPASTSGTSSPTSSARTSTWRRSIRSAGRCATCGRTRNGASSPRGPSGEASGSLRW